MPDAITLSVDQLNTLLRMYLAWPKHVGESPDEEANEFYLWLSTELHEDELVDITGGLDGVKHFIKANGDMTPAAKYLKGRQSAKASDGREDARIAINTQVFSLIYDCAKDPSLEGTIVRGMMMDMARNGMRLETASAVPSGSILSMTVAQTGTVVTLYHLTGEVRWASSTAESHHLGVSIFNIEDFRQWEEFFHMSSLM